METTPHRAHEADLNLRVLSWNVRGIRGLGGRLDVRLDAIAADGADVVALQEVSARPRTWERLRDGLARRGWSNALFSGDPTADRKRYGNVLASPELEPLAAGYHHAWREDGLSDHSAVWAVFGRAPGGGVRRG